MGAEFRACLRRKDIAPFKAAHSLVPKELGQADHDLHAARRSCDAGEYKWATIQAYYAMFHAFGLRPSRPKAARPLLYVKGYREKSHYCLSVALLELYVDTGKLPLSLVKDFDRAMLLREEADYKGEFSEAGAREVIGSAERFIAVAKQLLGHWGPGSPAHERHSPNDLPLFSGLTSQCLSAIIATRSKTAIARRILMKEYQFPVIIEYDPEEDVYLADCPLLQGCYTDGKTYEEALENIRDAIQLCIESRLAVGDPIPTPELVRVAV